MPQRRREDLDSANLISGGRFVQPTANEILPPVRTERIEHYSYNYAVPTGGTFVNPGVLPPVRNSHLQSAPERGNEYHLQSGPERGNEYHLQGGRFVEPAADQLLPPVRTAQIQYDPDNAYHFGAQIGAMSRRREDE